MSKKLSPGPWKLNRNRFEEAWGPRLEDANGEYLGFAAAGDGYLDHDRPTPFGPDERAIEAVPEMLELLRAAAGKWPDSLDKGDFIKLEALLERIEGETCAPAL